MALSSAPPKNTARSSTPSRREAFVIGRSQRTFMRLGSMAYSRSDCIPLMSNASPVGSGGAGRARGSWGW